MSVSITCYDGVLSIGGNKILLEDEERNARLFFDFGLPFARRYLFFEEYLKPRAGVGLRDPLRLGLLPPLEGIYRADFVAALSPEDEAFLTSSPLYRHLDIDGVLLSHAHLDHSGYISFLQADIPIYTTAMTAFIAKVVQDIGQSSDIEREVCYFTWRELEEGLLHPVSQKKNPLYHYQGRPFLLLDQPSLVESGFWSSSPVFTKEIRPKVREGAVDKIGSLPMRYFPVDHSIFGATAFAVETSAGWVVYTGDFRLHGRYGHLTKRFIEEVAALNPVALICEGTRIDDDKRVTEEEVYDAALEASRGASGLIIADFGARNVERLITFLQVAKEIGRRLAISPADAYLLEAMRVASPPSDAEASSLACHVPGQAGCRTQDLPDVAQDEHLVVYADVKSAPRPWEENLRNRYRREGRLIGAPEVRGDPGGYILCFSFFDINDLIDIEPKEATYIYSSSEAFNEEMEMDLRRLRNWLDHFHIRFVGAPDDPSADKRLHASGHVNGRDIIDLIRRIRPQVVIPVHTVKPKRFSYELRGDIRVRLPKKGRPMELG